MYMPRDMCAVRVLSQAMTSPLPEFIFDVARPFKTRVETPGGVVHLTLTGSELRIGWEISDDTRDISKRGSTNPVPKKVCIASPEIVPATSCSGGMHPPGDRKHRVEDMQVAGCENDRRNSLQPARALIQSTSDKSAASRNADGPTKDVSAPVTVKARHPAKVGERDSCQLSNSSVKDRHDGGERKRKRVPTCRPQPPMLFLPG